ncbi:hypothetical protein ABVT39_000436 [Epinephelus coioides]
MQRINWHRKCVVGDGETVPADGEPTPSAAYVTFGYRKFHEFAHRSIDIRLHANDNLRVGGSVLTDGGRFGFENYKGIPRSF